MSEHELEMAELQSIRQSLYDLTEVVLRLVKDRIQKEWIGITEVSELLSLTPSHIRNHKDQMQLVYSQNKKGGKLLFSRESIIKYLEKKSNRKYIANA